MQKTQFPSLGREDHSEKEMAIHSIFLPGKSHGQRSLAGSIPWSCKRVRHHFVTKNNKEKSIIYISVVIQSLSHIWLFVTPWTAARQVSPSLGVCSNSCPLSQWCHPAIFSSVIPFSSCLQSFPASRSFPMSRLFTSGGQSILCIYDIFSPFICHWAYRWFLSLLLWIMLQWTWEYRYGSTDTSFRS